MICIIAGKYIHAERWASAQHLGDDEWFFPSSEYDLNGRENFHVVTLDTASEIPPATFERLFRLALARGKQNRQ